jgi:hypothetical protein
MPRNLLAPLLVWLFAACAAGNLGASADRNVISREEIVDTPASTAYELVQSLRPQWLRLREEFGIGRSNDLVVYLDNARMGGRASLREIGLGSIHSLRYFDPAAANLRWGAGHAYGAILVSTRAEGG